MTSVTESALKHNSKPEVCLSRTRFLFTTAGIVYPAERNAKGHYYRRIGYSKTSQSEREGVLTPNDRSRTKEGIRLMSIGEDSLLKDNSTRGHGRGARDNLTLKSL